MPVGHWQLLGFFWKHLLIVKSLTKYLVGFHPSVRRPDLDTLILAIQRRRPAELPRQPDERHPEPHPVLLDGQRASVAVEQQPDHVARAEALPPLPLGEFPVVNADTAIGTDTPEAIAVFGSWCTCTWWRLGERSGVFLLGCCHQPSAVASAAAIRTLHLPARTPGLYSDAAQ